MSDAKKPANAVEAFEQILTRISGLEAKVDRLLSHLGADRQAQSASDGGAVAPLSDIRGERGDVEFKKDPPRWKGTPLAPIRASQCPPEYLEIAAGFFDFKADKPRPGKEDFAKYDRLNAARCRRWAIEIREGRVKQEPIRDREDGPSPPADDGYSSGNMPPPPDDFGPPPGDDDTPF
jgi:hypothetical protein